MASELPVLVCIDEGEYEDIIEIDDDSYPENPLIIKQFVDATKVIRNSEEELGGLRKKQKLDLELFVCGSCSTTFQSDEDYQNHVESCKSGESDLLNQQIGSVNDEMSTVTLFVNTTPTENSTVTSPPAFEKMSKLVKGDNSQYYCPRCNEGFISKASLYLHCKKCLNSIKCDKCNLFFKSKQIYETHLSSTLHKNGPPKLICDFPNCNKMFSKPELVWNHMLRDHSNPKPTRLSFKNYQSLYEWLKKQDCFVQSPNTILKGKAKEIGYHFFVCIGNKNNTDPLEGTDCQARIIARETASDILVLSYLSHNHEILSKPASKPIIDDISEETSTDLLSEISIVNNEVEILNDTETVDNFLDISQVTDNCENQEETNNDTVNELKKKKGNDTIIGKINNNNNNVKEKKLTKTIPKNVANSVKRTTRPLKGLILADTSQSIKKSGGDNLRVSYVNISKPSSLNQIEDDSSDENKLSKTRQRLETKLIQLLRLIVLGELEPLLPEFLSVIKNLCHKAEGQLNNKAQVRPKNNVINSLKKNVNDTNTKIGTPSPPAPVKYPKIVPKPPFVVQVLQTPHLVKCANSNNKNPMSPDVKIIGTKSLATSTPKPKNNTTASKIDKTTENKEPKTPAIIDFMEAHETIHEEDEMTMESFPPKKKKNDKSFTNMYDVEKHKNLVMHVGSQQLNLVHLKSIDIHIDDFEVAKLTERCNVFKKGWLFDCVITSFLEIVSKKFKNIIVVDPAVTDLLARSIDFSQAFPDLKFTSENTLLLPMNFNNGHWALMVAKIPSREILFFDPKKGINIHSYGQFFKPWMEILNRTSANRGDWTLIQPQRMLQTDSCSCGVFVCWYAQQFLYKKPYIFPFQPDIYRKHIFTTLVDKARTLVPATSQS